jgi:hypothetical protein
MSDDLSAAEAELLTEGMTSYWDAKFALDVFEQKIQEVANRVLNENLNKVRVAFGLEEIPESHRWPLGETCEEGRVVLGGGYGWRSERAWEANMRFGVGWMPETAGKPRRGFLGIEICEGSQWKSGAYRGRYGFSQTSILSKTSACTIGQSTLASCCIVYWRILVRIGSKAN